ncbi:MAG TPA: YibE/F family protein [Nocardioidaceae bacterium]|nr:YibE/F family protein [Nocardioidaceae bacterium]
MAGSHPHSHAVPTNVPLARSAVVVLLGFLLLCALATVAGVVMLWPDGDKVDQLREGSPYAAERVTYQDATVTDVLPACADERSTDDTCGKAKAKLDEGPEAGTEQTVPVPTALIKAGLTSGDSIRLMRLPPQPGQEAQYAFDKVDRLTPLWIMGAIFVLVVAAVARLRGILALVSLGIGGILLFQFMLPALLAGSSGIAVALTGSAAIMFGVLYLTHGPTVRTSAALAGTLVGIVITAGLGEVAVRAALLTGVSNEDSAYLTALAGDLDYRGLLMCALVVAGLGILNDVTITQSSAVWELRAAGPSLTRRELFTSGMRIGRDHIASTIYTLVFAYAGSALALLLVITLYSQPVLDTLSLESISEEIVRTLASGIGLVLAVPVTTAIAALTVGSPHEDEVDAYQRRH